jgi:hypothetical protein
MPDGEYTFVHLCKYGDPTFRKRIWQSETHNFLSGFHVSGPEGAGVHHNTWVARGLVVDDDAWRLTIDQRAFGRINAGQIDGTNESGETPTNIVINVDGQQPDEYSAWDVAEVLLYDGNLDAVDIFTMEVYFATKYGLNFPSLFPTLPSARSPVLLMNAASVTASDSLVNLATGAIIDPTNAAGVLVQSHSPGDGFGANKAFDYMSGTTTSGFTIGADLMPDGEYTFVHLTRYGPGSYKRIWQSSTTNFLSGFHDSTDGAYHGDWITPLYSRVPMRGEWRLTVDQRSYARINAGQVEGSNNNGQTPGDIVINPAGISTNEHSQWCVAEAMLYEGNLDTVDILAMEAYLMQKYGLTFAGSNILPSGKSPIVLLNASSMVATDSLVDRSGGGNHPTSAINVTRKSHAAADGFGATKAFSYISGDTTAGFKIGADIMPDGEYTFVHLVKYGGAERQRIWQSSTNNFLSGFWRDNAGLYHSPTALGNNGGDSWIAKGQVSNNDAWRLTVDQRTYGRINAGQLEGTNTTAGTTATPGDIVINLDGTYPGEKSSWDVAEVLLYDGNLDAADISALETYLIDKYGLTFA